MSSIETRIASSVLRAIRKRRNRNHEGLRVQEPSRPLAATLREAQFADFEVIRDLRTRHGLSSDSLDNWDRLWRRNPVIDQLPKKLAIGWVLESENKVVGYLGNIPLLYHYGDRILIAATASGLVTEPAYRACSLSLNAAFYRQNSVDLYLTTTAIEAVGKIARAFQCASLPQPEYDSMLFWVLRSRPFVKAITQKLGLGHPVSAISNTIGSFLLVSDKILRQRRASAKSDTLTMTTIRVDEIGNDFEDLWRQKLKETPRLLADRSPATLRWHFDIPGDIGETHVLCCYASQKLRGYAVVRHEPPNQVNGLRRSIIADMLAAEDDPNILESLLIAAYHDAGEAGSHVFEMLGFPPRIRRLCDRWHPYVRKYPSCPFYYKAADPALHDVLADGIAWYASPFDGDTTLWSFGTAS
jgi:hypothetical protein